MRSTNVGAWSPPRSAFAGFRFPPDVIVVHACGLMWRPPGLAGRPLPLGVELSHMEPGCG